LPPLGSTPCSDEPLPATPGQQRLWFIDQLRLDAPTYNEPFLLEIHAPVDARVLQRSLNEIVRRHESWRTQFLSERGQVFQRVIASTEMPLGLVDLTGLPPAEREIEAMRLAIVEARRPFDLATAPLVRALLMRVGEDQSWLVLTAHHIVIDGFSYFYVFLPELHALYAAFAAGQPSPLPALPLQYSDFTRWQRGWLTDERLAPQLAYWKTQVADLQDLDLPTDYPRSVQSALRGARCPVTLSPALTERLRALGRRCGVSLVTAVLSAWKVLLYRYTGQTDLAVGIPVSGRRQPQLNPLIGFFVNNLMVRTHLDESMSFAQLLERVHGVLQEARKNQDVPFERLVAMRDAPRTLNESPLYNTVCNLVPPVPFLPPEWTVRRFDLGTAKCDLYLELCQWPSGLVGHIEYRTDLFSEATVARMAQHLQALIEDAIRDPEQQVSRLRLLTLPEAELIAAFQEGPPAPALPCLPQLFEAQVERTPDAVALVFEGQQLTYRELNRRANLLAHHLRGLGVGPEVLVGLCVERSFDMVVGVLGIHKAGGAYLPLDPGYPAERLHFMLQDSRVSLVLTHTQVQSARPWPRTLWLDTDWPLVAGGPDMNPPSLTRPEHLAYVIYTSGSTGRPKGVEIEHRGIPSMAKVIRDLLGLGVGSRVLQFSSFNFDVSVADITATLTSGATLVLAPRVSLIPGPDLARLLREQAISTMVLPPSALALVPPGDYPTLRSIIAAGEACPSDLVARWAPGRRFFNAYGPTEATVYTTFAECNDPTEIPPIGRPIPGTQVYILDRAMQPVPIGVPGELYIGGIGLARGYLRRPELTTERFCANPFATGGPRLYKTGDRVRFRPDGNIIFLGRTDRQIKLRGFRIELGEIEVLLAQHPDVAEAAVVLREDAPGDKRLAAYVVPRPPATLEPPAALTSWIKARVPEHMMPSSFTVLERLPLSPNGKLDRNALPTPTQNRAAASAYEPPRTEVERVIVETWREVLHREHVGVQDNFFDLGGHSLMLAEVLARLQAKLRTSVTMLDLFQHPTVRDLAARLSPTHESTLPAAADSLLRQSRERATRQRAALGLSHDSPSLSDTGSAGVAIIGMAGRFPGAPDIETFYRNLREGTESIRVFSVAELQAAGVDPALYRDPSYVPASGFLDGVERFDAPFFGFLPREAEIMDPQHRLFLECAWEALEDAGYDPKRCTKPIGVFAGAGSSNYLRHHIDAHPEVSKAVGEYHLHLATDKDFLSTRVAYKLDLSGPALTVQTACSTSLVTVAMAYLALLTNQCDIALAGGASVDLERRYGYTYREGMIFSPDGHCRAFDEAAQGTVIGDGAGVVVLKRLEDALADGDHIHAVIRSAALNNDGSAKVGYTAPSVMGQAQVVAQAIALADVAPETIGYVEAHGTGTPLGDPIEIAALREAFGGCRPGSIAIGSVKTNIGHLNSAAGIAGLIKAVLSLRHRELLPSLHCNRPNPKLDFEHSPFYVNTRLTPWSSEGPRRAGVSSFGIGGTNAHVVLEEAPTPPEDTSAGRRTSHLLVLSARSAAALDAATRKLAKHLRAHPELPLADVAYTLQVGRRAFGFRSALVCATTEQAALVLGGPAHPETRRNIVEQRPVAFLFPGQGSQFVDMGRKVYQSEPTFRFWVDRCAELLLPSLGRDLRKLLFPLAPEREDAAADLRATAFAQPALFVVEYALAKLWMEWGLRPQSMLGHSIGEYVAACLADVFELPDALWLVAQRGRLMQELPAGAMLALPLPEADARALCGDALSVAAVNGPALTVIAGPLEDIDAVERQLAERGISGRRLHTSHAFHSPMMDPILPAFERCVAQVKRRPPTIPYLSNVTGSWAEAQQVTSPAYWARHLRETVRFSAGLEVLFREPDRALLEVGPGEVLSTIVARHQERPAGLLMCSSLPRRSDRESDDDTLLAALGKMWRSGVEVDWAGHHAHGRPRRTSLPTYPFERQRYWVEPRRPAVRTEDGPRATPPRASGDAPPGREGGEPALDLAAAPHVVEPAQYRESTRPPLKQPYVAPRGDLERELAEIWSTVLGVEPVGRDDDLFDLGGDSFVAVQLLARINAVMRLNLASHELLQAPTIAALARSIEHHKGAADGGAMPCAPQHAPLVDLRRDPSKQPLFLVHPVGGHVYVYRDLASCLGQEQRVYGLEAQGVDGRMEPLGSIPEMAVQYVAAVRARQPEGPYYLGGMSFGGLVAYEMAQILQTQGQEVALVVMIDTPGPGEMPASLNSDAEIIAYLLDLGALDPALAAEICELAPEEQLARFIRSTGQATRIVPPMPPEQMRHFLNLWRVGMKAMIQYSPAPSRCPVVFFRAAERDAVNSTTPERGWRDVLLGSFDIHEVPGNHITMTYPPNVKRIADVLIEYLRKS